jgi:hypothetical protein
MTEPPDPLEMWRSIYESGNEEAREGQAGRRWDAAGFVVLYCLYYCLTCGRPIPPWLAKAFCAAFNKVINREASSWDEVFGKPVAKGKQLKAAQRRHEKSPLVYRRVRELHDAGAAINKGLFDKVGAENGVSGTIAAELYYEVKNLARSAGWIE